MEEVQIQTELLKAGVLTIDEVREHARLAADRLAQRNGGGIVILTIDNLDGAGAVDYSAALSADGPLQIARTLNAPSRCSGSLWARRPIRARRAPRACPARARRGLRRTAARALFTGYIATEPVAEYAGAGLAGPVYRVAFTAVSDEWLLDKQTAHPDRRWVSQSRAARCSPRSPTARPPAC